VLICEFKVGFFFVFSVKLAQQLDQNYQYNILLDAVCPFWVCEMAQLVEALRYKPEGRGFDSR